MNRAIKCSILIFTLYSITNGAKITKEQMQQATEPVRLVCIQKTKVTETSLTNMKAGKLDDVKELKCYINCVMEMMQIVSEVLVDENREN
jgi:PBP/GOBP family